MFSYDFWEIFKNNFLQFLKKTSQWQLLSCYYGSLHFLCYFHFKKNHSWEIFLIAIVFCLFLYISVECISLNLISLNLTRYTISVRIFAYIILLFGVVLRLATSSLDSWFISIFMFQNLLNLKFGNHFFNLTLIFSYNMTFCVHLC